MILNFIMGFVFGLTFALIVLLIVAWHTVQEKKDEKVNTDTGEVTDVEEYF